MRLGDIDCWIEVDGKSLDEYGIELSGDLKKCTAWIPSKAGQEFAVSWRDPCLSRATVGYVYADGKYTSGRVMRPNRAMVSAFVDGTYTSPTQLRKYQFSDMTLTDDDSYLNKTSQEVGEITVKIWLCTVGAHVPLSVKTLDEPSKMHEKTKKGLAHSVGFSTTTQLPQPVSAVSVQTIGASPMATFTFRYRSIDMLRANGIAPMPAPAAVPLARKAKSPKPVAGPSRGRKRKAASPLTPERDTKRDVKPVIIDMDEEDEAEERIRKAEDELRRARLEMHRRRGNTRIKLEQVLPILPGEVLDLTELSD
ncbi:uncharacterized protein SCHCODRAFT_02642631 [Schizophyllum commune H4-8]|nr:uncharacterized protein SCHCODRAFT_02642631 [Schizophyllum commune H4-8]KAI5885852.1 hypothetical protein SCHCODRAFT_02642631 [Schizophyllum commune H4-8]